jgi:ATP-dependent helicase/nuclease subunit A
MNESVLNRNQKKIIDAKDSVFISAGAGTGKTHAIVEKFCSLICDGKNPVDVLSIAAITFTRKAASEMKERIIRRLERINDRQKNTLEMEHILNAMPFAWIDTIHGFCARILREFSLEANLDPSFEILDEYRKEQKIKKIILVHLDQKIRSESAKEIKNLLLRFRLDGLIELLRTALSRRRFEVWDIYRYLENEIEQPDTIENEFGALFLQILVEYETECTRDNTVDFEALLLYTLYLMENNGEVRSLLTERFRYIIVDEFQDTNILQKRILDCFSKDNKTALVFVGDGKQSIYRFNGAEIAIFNTTRDTYDAEHYISLEENYRSYETLIDFFNRFFPRVFGNSNGQYGITYENLASGKREGVTPFSEYAGRVRLLPNANALDEECQNLSAYILYLIREEKRRYKDFAVLLRSMTHIDTLTGVLEEYCIPYFHVGSASFYQRKEIVSLLSLVKALYNPADEYSLTQLLMSFLSPFSEGDLLEMRKTDPRFLYVGLNTFTQNTGNGSTFLSIFESLRKTIALRSIGSILREAIRMFDYDLRLAALSDGNKRWLNVKKLLEIADTFGGNTSIREFIEQMAQETALKEEEAVLESENDDVVRVMTIHKSKGLQFPIVILPDLGFFSANRSERFLTDRENKTIFFADESIPSVDGEKSDKLIPEGPATGTAKNYLQFKEIESSRELEEKKRLLYVAFTRAEEEIVLSFHTKKKRTAEETGDGSETKTFEKQKTPNSKSKEPSIPTKGFLPLLYVGGLVTSGPDWVPGDQSEYPEIISCVPEEALTASVPNLTIEKPNGDTVCHIPETAFSLEDQPYQKYLSPSLLTSEDAYITLRKYDEKKLEDLLPELFKLTSETQGYFEEIGTLVHKMLEVYAEKDLSAVTLSLVEKVNYAFGYSEEVVKKVHRIIQKIAPHALFNEISRSCPCFSEKPVRKRFGNHILSGTIDKLYFLDGYWHVLDFKASKQDERFLEKYWFQMQFYLYILKGLLDPAPEKATLFFLEEGCTLDVPLDGGFEDTLKKKIKTFEADFSKQHSHISKA